MSNMLRLYVNKSNKYKDIYDIILNKTVAKLYPREAFVVYGCEGERYNLRMRNPNRKVIDTTIADRDGFIDTNCHWCENFPYGTAMINGNEYKTYLMRKAKNIYTPSGNYWGGVAANMLVATNNSIVGEEHPTWKAIDYVKRSTDGKWIKVSGSGYNHGFVDMGLEDGSMYNNIPFYGSW